jgi:hypothetical protein
MARSNVRASCNREEVRASASDSSIMNVAPAAGKQPNRRIAQTAIAIKRSRRNISENVRAKDYSPEPEPTTTLLFGAGRTALLLGRGDAAGIDSTSTQASGETDVERSSGSISVQLGKGIISAGVWSNVCWFV